MSHFSKDDGPSAGDVHVDTAGEKKRAKLSPIVGDAAFGDKPASITKLDPAPLYVYRSVLNAAALISWAKGQGFKTTVPAEEMHVTITYSKTPVDWMAMGDSWSGDEKGRLTVRPGGPRKLVRFGQEADAVVLVFFSSDLAWRHQAMMEGGASWDWPDYSPHVTLSFDAPDIDVEALEPYTGEIVLGPEVFEPIKENWKDGIVEKSFSTFFKVSGVDQTLGLVFGWGIVCKGEDGKDYYDSQQNHIPEAAMVEATTEFMKGQRDHGDMHVRMGAGSVVHSFPLTAEIAKAMGIETKKTGWMVATAPDPAMLAKFASGEYTGFSIGGEHLEIDGKPVEA